MIRVRVRERGEDGFALVAVIGLMLVIAVLVLVLVSLSLSATSFTGSSRATVQARAAAQAGVDATRVTLQSGCTATGAVTPVGSTGAYQTTVSVPNGSGGWTVGCPTSTSTQVRIVSVGTASATAVGTNTSGNSVTVAAVLSPGGTAASSSSTGPAVYSYGPGALGGSGVIAPYNGSSADVIVKTGDVTCSGAGLASVSNVVVANGKLTMQGSCNIGGNAFSSGALGLSGGVKVGGNAVASSISVADSSVVTGGAWATGALSVLGNANITGNASAASLSLTGSSSISGNAWITGATTSQYSGTIAGTLTTTSVSDPNPSGPAPGRTTLVASPGPSPYATPSAPAAPPWTDYAYSDSDWSGYTIVRLSGGTCGLVQLNVAMLTIGTSKGVIDARNCTGGVSLAGVDALSLSSSLAIIASKFTLTGSGRIASATAANLWLITPDTTADGVPTCPTGGGFTLDGDFRITGGVSTMVYTPCDVAIASSSDVIGQIWARQVSISGAGALRYSAVGLPGYDLSSGTRTTSGPRTVLSLGTVTGG